MVLIHRREGIINSTIEAIQELGIQNLSTKEIARREGVSEGTLFRHYKNKTAILLAVLEHYSQYDEAMIQACLKRNLNPLETISYYIPAYAEYYQGYPEITAIFQAYDSFMSEPELSPKMKSIILTRNKFMQKTIEDAIEEGYLIENTNPLFFTDLLWGGFKELCFRWRMEKQGFLLKDETINMIEMLLRTFSKNRET